MAGAWLRLKRLGETVGTVPGSLEARQWQWLRACLARNAASEFGRTHGFERIRSVEAYRQALPMATYDDHRPWIERCAAGEVNALFAGRALAFERTGGSTGGAKWIPYTADSFRDLRRAIVPWLADLVSAEELEDGCAYWAISPALRGREYTPGGIPVGVADGAYLGADVPPLFAELSALPPWVGELQDFREWQLATLYGLLVRSDLALISVWSPTFFLSLLEALDDRSEELIAVLGSGGGVSARPLPADHAARARLRQYREHQDTRVLWPHLRLVSAWGDGAARGYARALARRLPQARFQPKGLLSTEGVVTVPGRDGAPQLAADSGFFEFIDHSGALLLAHQLAAGQSYEVVLTTAGGLYRYRTDDVVTCAGMADGLPLLHFAGRAGLVSDLVGEKLTEAFVAACLPPTEGFQMLVPCVGEVRGYALIVDAEQPVNRARLVDTMEQGLARNPQYAYARRIGQLHPLRIVPVPHPLATYMQRLRIRGMLLGAIKVPALRPEPDWLAAFTGRVACTSH